MSLYQETEVPNPEANAGRKFASRFISRLPINLTRPNFSNLACLFDLPPLDLN